MQVHGAVVKVGLDSNIFVGNTSIAMYGRCNGCFGYAHKMFEDIPNGDVVSWNAMVAGFAQNGKFERAIEMCREMMERGKPKPDAGMMASVLPAMSKTSFDNVELVRRMFDVMGSRNLVCWNAMIAIYVNNSMEKEAVGLFVKMEKGGVELDAVMFANVLPACGVVSALSLGKRIDDIIRRKQMCPNIVVENALMDMYASCGSLEDAREVFEAMKNKDVMSWTSIISAYGMHGHGLEAVALFEQMLESGLTT